MRARNEVEWLKWTSRNELKGRCGGIGARRLHLTDALPSRDRSFANSGDKWLLPHSSTIPAVTTEALLDADEHDEA
ncbi:hypothetical protein AB1N83_012881 [Pleurotus pulmonarius]